MTITTFNPMILTNIENSENIIKLFEELGFERRHEVDNVDNRGINSVRMKEANGFYVDVAQTHLEKDITTIRMNVRDYEEAYEFLKNHGFKNVRGSDETVESASAKSCLMISPSGFSIQLTQHIRKEDK
jgi:hypothetical protein